MIGGFSAMKQLLIILIYPSMQHFRVQELCGTVTFGLHEPLIISSQYCRAALCTGSDLGCCRYTSTFAESCANSADAGTWLAIAGLMIGMRRTRTGAYATASNDLYHEIMLALAAALRL